MSVATKNMPLVVSINKATLLPILQEQGMTFTQFKQQGVVNISPGVKITLTGRCTYTLIDESSRSGDGIVDLVTPAQRELLPCCHIDADGTREQRIQAKIQEQAAYVEARKQQRFQKRFLTA